MTTTLVLGGARSGKSRHAAHLLRDEERLTYVVTRPEPDQAADPALAERVRRAREDRPGAWQTVHTHDLTRALLASRHAVLVDSLPDWVRAQCDEHQLWSDPLGARGLIDGLVDELCVASRGLPFPVVLVTLDPSWSTPPDDPAERLCQELVGHVNQRVAATVHHVHVVIAGRVLDLSSAPVVPRR